MDTAQADTFIRNYRDSLSEQRDRAISTLNQQRDNDYATIMSNANKAGAMYSNIPARQKTQYESQTYLPGVAKAQSTYQTGIDTLKSNTATYKNNIKALEEAIADLNNDIYVNQNMY